MLVVDQIGSIQIQTKYDRGNNWIHKKNWIKTKLEPVQMDTDQIGLESNWNLKAQFEF